MSYSSDDFDRDWRYSIEKEFVKPSGDPFEYAEGGLKEWGDEDIVFPGRRAKLGDQPLVGALSDDGRRFAMSNGAEAHVYDIDNFKHNYTLQGHITDIEQIAFRPGSSTQLVTGARQWWERETGKVIEPQIILWDLDHQPPNTLATSDAVERLARNAANSILAEMKFSSSIPLDASEQKELAKALEHPIRRFVLPRGVKENVKIHGRLIHGCEADTFSPCGNTFFYMPGNYPNSNGNDNWELRLYSFDRHEDVSIMKGHFDTIMWAGYSEDGSRFGIASWDQTFSIWNAKDASTTHLFKTEQQNWAGGFSRDAKQFAGLSGDGKMHIYDLEAGVETLTMDLGMGWCRAVSWHPSNKMVAVGGQNWATLALVDVEKHEIVQTHKLNGKLTKVKNPIFKDVGQYFLETSVVHFVDGGRKIVTWTTGDGSAEVYDIEQGTKWRFARTGTMNAPDDDSKVTSKGGYGLLIREDKSSKELTLVSLDGVAARFWTIPMTG